MGCQKSLVTPPTRIRGSAHRGRHDDAANEGPARSLHHQPQTAWAFPGRGCGVGGAYCSARRSRAGRRQGAGGRQSAGGRGTPGGLFRSIARRRRWRWGTWTGVRMTSALVERQTSSNALENFASRSRIRKLNAAARSPRSRRRLRACWATHGPVGWAVTPARCTCRLPSSMTNSTYSRRRNTVSTVKKSHARMPAACRRRNDRQGVGARRGAGSL